MTAEKSTKRRWFVVGCAVTAAASLGLMTFPLALQLPFLSDVAAYSLIVLLTALMGLGATLAVFNLK